MSTSANVVDIDPWKFIDLWSLLPYLPAVAMAPMVAGIAFIIILELTHTGDIVADAAKGKIWYYVPVVHGKKKRDMFVFWMFITCHVICASCMMHMSPLVYYSLNALIYSLVFL